MQNILEHSYLEQKMVVNSYLEAKYTGAQLFSAKMYNGTAI